MPEQNVTTKFKVDISDLKKGIADANKSIKLANAEFKNATAGLDDWSKSADGLTAKIEQQNIIVDAEKKKLELLKEQLDRINKSQVEGQQIVNNLTAQYNAAVKEYGATSDEAKKYAKQLSDAQNAQERNTKAADDLNIKIINQDTAVKNATAQVDKYESALADLNRSSSDTTTQTENLTDKVELQQKELDDLKTKYKNVASEQGLTSDEARALASQISDLSGKLKENRDKLDAAEDAVNDLDKSLENASDSAENAARGGFTVLKGVLSNLVTGVIDKLISKVTNLTGDAISASDSMAKFEQTMGFAGYNDKTIKQASQDVKDYADRTKYELDTIANTTAQLAANGIKDYTGLTKAAGNLNAVAGGNADTFKSVSMVLTQTAGAGKLTTENWNQLTNAIPGASGRLQDALKAANAYTGDFREALANGKITAEEFNAAIMQLGNDPIAVEAATSVSTFEGAMAKLKSTAVTGIMRIYDAIGREKVAKAIIKINNIIAKVIPPIEKSITWCIAHIPEITAVVVGLATATAVYLGYTTAVQIMTNGFMSLSIAQKAVAAAQKILNVVMSANPIGLIVAAVAALVAAFITLWHTSDSFRNFWIGLWEKIKNTCEPVISALSDWFTKLWDNIKIVWDEFAPYVEAAWEKIKTIFTIYINILADYFMFLWESIKKIWDFVSPYFKMIWENIKVIFAAVIPILSGYFKTAWDNIKIVWDLVVNYFKMIWDNIKTIFAVVKDILTGDFAGAWEGIKHIWDNVIGYFQEVWNGIANIFGNVGAFFKNIFTEAWEAIKKVFANVGDYFGDIWDTIKSKFTSIGTNVADAIGGAFKAAINAVIDTVEGALNKIPKAINTAIGVLNEIPGVSISKMSEITLPRLEKGGILKRGQIGLLEGNGAEAVVPLERNTGGLRKIAGIIAEGMKRTGDIIQGNEGRRTVNNYNFNQTNNSPKALSRYEIYRQTKNLLNAAKGG